MGIGNDNIVTCFNKEIPRGVTCNINHRKKWNRNRIISSKLERFYISHFSYL